MRNGMQLNPGDKIGLVATARRVDQETILSAMQTVTQWGYHPVPGKTLYLSAHQFAGDDKSRAQDLQDMLDDPDIKAILCMRGGYGTIRIMEHLDFTAFTMHPKWICGFSDITVLHAHINDKLGLPTLHCAMPYTFQENTQEALTSMLHALRGAPDIIHAPAHALNKPGTTEGVIIGGNLSILYALLGTKYGFSTAGKILFLEDVDEYIYHIDRMCMSLKLAGKLDHLKGIVAGGFTDMKDNAVPFGKSAAEVIAGHVAHLHIPVCFDFPAGHVHDNRAIVFGEQAILSVNTHGATLQW